MKKYVFLTQSISGITGNQRYVNNKTRFLRENGWDVIVLWNYNISPVELEYVKCFDNKKYIHHELKFYPSWYTERKRNKVVDRLAAVVGTADQIVVESNKLELGAWGELLAKKLCCKHINFVTSEHIKLHNKESFDFFYKKLQRQEFFSINEAQAKIVFTNFIQLEHPEKFYWSASMGVEVEDYGFPDFDQMPRADFTITHFGREKKYFSYMLKELKTFIAQQKNKTFNLFFLGDLGNDANIRKTFNLDNVNLSISPKNIKIIPRQIFTKSDIVVATAGCANIASINGGKVISMDVNRNVPLGLYGYTTLDRNTYSGKYFNERSLSEWLQVLLIDKIQLEPMKKTREPHSFDYQMSFTDNCDNQYIDSTKVRERMTRHDDIYAFLVKVGLYRIVEYFYFKKRGAKLFWL